MELRLDVENVKCRGCARSIEKALTADSRITRVTVTPEHDLVLIEASEDVRAEAAAALARIGYPEKGSVEGMKAAAAAAKSFVSCAIGRLSD
ncbi:MAG TPA: heavy-metal-associated domain-containing protein [Burkholderiales bacterium]|nr:heavy-metal-associated domain-containing protein [Burkholderiales bacterium]